MLEPFLLLLIFALFWIPGALLAFALLYKQNFTRVEKLLIGFLLGLLVPPAVSMTEFLFLGTSLTTGLILLNLLFTFLAGLALAWKNGVLQKAPASIKDAFANWKDVKHNWPLKLVAVALVSLMVFGFWLRFSHSWSTSFFEFDPYYYDELTRMLVQQGSIPAFSDLSYFPHLKSHREFPFVHYLTGEWVLFHQDFTGQLFNKDDMVLIIQLYPPLLGVLLAFAAFLYLKEGYGPYVGLLGASLMALMPQLITKFAAGVSEQAPLGIFLSVALFAFFGLAISRKSLALGAVAGLLAYLSVLGSAHHIWPFFVLGAYAGLQAIVDYLSDEEALTSLKICAITTLGGFVGNALLYSYRLQSLDPLTYTDGTLILALGTLFAGLLCALTHFKVASRLNVSPRKLFAGFMAVGLAVFMISPFGGRLVGALNGTLGYATVGNALYKTVQEGAATNSGYYKSSFGEINPETLLLVATLVMVVYAFAVLWRRSEKQYAAAFGLVAATVVLANSFMDSFLSILKNFFATAYPPVATLIQFVISSDVFLYLLVSLAASLLVYGYAEKEKRDKLTLLTLLIFFPVSYIGLSRVKYLVHLAVAVVIGSAFLAGELQKLANYLNDAYHYADARQLQLALSILVVLGTLVVFNAELPYANASSQSLEYSRISPDWQLTLDWMRTHSTPQDRYISWWDYGHWTVFFGETKTVVDPGNYYAEMDQEVAYAFVQGPQPILVKTMKDHGATYALLDSELVPKWGALNFLAGTYNGTNDNFTPAIPNTANPGGSDWEIEHSFEQIFTVYQVVAAGQQPQPATCPGVIPRPMYYSAFGALYCMDASTGSFTLFIPPSTEKPLKAPALVQMGGDSNPNLAPLQNSGLYYNTNPAFMNLNPDLDTLSGGKLKSKLFSAPYVQLFFFEKYPGFQLMYKSPNGQVKLFKLVDANAGLSSTQTPTPTPTLPAPTPAPAPTHVPTATPIPTLGNVTETLPSPSAPASPTPAPTLSPSAANGS